MDNTQKILDILNRMKRKMDEAEEKYVEEDLKEIMAGVDEQGNEWKAYVYTGTSTTPVWGTYTYASSTTTYSTSTGWDTSTGWVK